MATLPGSGQLGWGQIRDFFGGPAGQIQFSDYYRGAGLVPDIPANSGIPTSGQISASDFYGATNLTPNLTNRTITAIGGALTSAFARFSVEPDGELFEVRQLGLNVTNTKVTDQYIQGSPIAGISGSFFYRFTLISGAALPPGGDNGLVDGTTLHSNATPRTIEQNRSFGIGVGSTISVVRLEIFDTSPGPVLASADITLNATIS